MKKLLALLSLAFVSTPAKAEEWKKLEATYQVLNAVDFIQTAHCLRANICHEANPIYGKNPKISALFAGKAASGVIHYLITRKMVEDYGAESDEARLWLYGTIALQGSVVVLNFRIIL